MSIATLQTGWIDEHTYRILDAEGNPLDYCTLEKAEEEFGLSLRYLERWYEDANSEPPKKNRFLGGLLDTLKPRREKRGRGLRVILKAHLRELKQKLTSAKFKDYKPPDVLDRDGMKLLTDAEIAELYDRSGIFAYKRRKRKSIVKDRPTNSRCVNPDKALRGIRLNQPRAGQGGPITIWRSRQDDVERILAGQESKPGSGGGSKERAGQRRAAADKRAKDWLEGTRKATGPLPTDVLWELAKEGGIRPGHFYRVRDQLGITTAAGQEDSLPERGEATDCLPAAEVSRRTGITLATLNRLCKEGIVRFQVIGKRRRDVSLGDAEATKGQRKRGYKPLWWCLSGQVIPSSRPTIEAARAKRAETTGGQSAEAANAAPTAPKPQAVTPSDLP